MNRNNCPNMSKNQTLHLVTTCSDWFLKSQIKLPDNVGLYIDNLLSTPCLRFQGIMFKTKTRNDSKWLVTEQPIISKHSEGLQCKPWLSRTNAHSGYGTRLLPNRQQGVQNLMGLGITSIPTSSEFGQKSWQKSQL